MNQSIAVTHSLEILFNQNFHLKPFTVSHQCFSASCSCSSVTISASTFLLGSSNYFTQTCGFSPLFFMSLQWCFSPKCLIGNWTDSFPFVNLMSKNTPQIPCFIVLEILLPMRNFVYFPKPSYPSILSSVGLWVGKSIFAGNDSLFEGPHQCSVKSQSKPY
jgi:hypothetical protein